MIRPDDLSKRWSRRRESGVNLIDLSDVDELIRVSNRLRHRSNAVQQAASRASVVLRDALKRSGEVCGKSIGGGG